MSHKSGKERRAAWLTQVSVQQSNTKYRVRINQKVIFRYKHLRGTWDISPPDQQRSHCPRVLYRPLKPETSNVQAMAWFSTLSCEVLPISCILHVLFGLCCILIFAGFFFWLWIPVSVHLDGIFPIYFSYIDSFNILRCQH